MIESYIEYVDDQFAENQDLNTIRNEIRAPSIHEMNNVDFDEIHRQVDLTPFDELIQTTFLQNPEWKEKVRQRKKRLSEMIKQKMSDLQTGATTWAKFAASLSRTMGSDAPMIAGFLLLTNKVFNIASDMYNQVVGYEGETGKVAKQFIEKNYTDATLEELHEVSAYYMNCD